MDHPETEEFIRKLDELSKEDFKDSFVPSDKSIFESEQILEHGRSDRAKVLEHSFYRENYQIISNFVSKLITDNLYDPEKDSNFDELYDIALKTQTRLSHDDFCTKLESNDNIDLDWLCSSYLKIFEQACMSSFKPFASKIQKKEIISCTTSFSIISKYDKNMKNVLLSFNSHIRNSIGHTNWYYDKKKNLLIFDDRKKPSVTKSPAELSKDCKEMLIKEDCFFSVHFTTAEKYLEENIRDSKYALEFLDFLDADPELLLKTLLYKGYSLKSINIALERRLRDEFVKKY